MWEGGPDKDYEYRASHTDYTRDPPALRITPPALCMLFFFRALQLLRLLTRALLGLWIFHRLLGGRGGGGGV